MVHYPDSYQVNEATPPPPVHACKCGCEEFKYSPATMWSEEGYGCMACGKFLAAPYKAAALSADPA